MDTITTIAAEYGIAVEQLIEMVQIDPQADPNRDVTDIWLAHAAEWMRVKIEAALGFEAEHPRDAEPDGPRMWEHYRRHAIDKAADEHFATRRRARREACRA